MKKQNEELNEVNSRLISKQGFKSQLKLMDANFRKQLNDLKTVNFDLEKRNEVLGERLMNEERRNAKLR